MYKTPIRPPSTLNIRKIGEICFCLGVLLSQPSVSLAEPAPQKHVLSNGLTIYTQEVHTAPLISFFVFYDVGSVNENIGITGISHLFEHMMFNGSSKYEPKEFDFKLEAAGGSSNGYTTRDFTAYLETFPPAAIDLVLDLEADRMASMRITPKNLEQERGIVKEERRLRTDNDNEGKMDELLYLLAYVAHPYRNPVVGFMSDLNNIKLSDTERYFRTYYTPNNAVAVIVGDFNTDALIKKVKIAFDRVPKGPLIPTVYGEEPDQEGERRATVVRESELPMVMTGWHVPGVSQEADVAALDVLQCVLARGESSRLKQTLVYSKEFAVDVSAYNDTMTGPSLFVVGLQIAPSHSPEEAEGALNEELQKLTSVPLSTDELNKAKKQLKADSLRGIATTEDLANQLGYHAVIYGSPEALKRMMDARDRVTAADLQRVVQKYFVKENRSVITLIPKEAAAASEKAGETP